MANFRPSFHTSLASKMVNDVYYQRTNLYYFLGKLDSWDNGQTPDPDNAYVNDVIIRDNIVYFRKVTANDVSIVCKMHRWRKDEIYDQWDHTQDMTNKPFYVMTADYNVYKCLNNNNGAKSTVEPTEINFDVVKTADGYLWKYMYNVPLIKRRKFSSTQYMPVQKALSDSFYSLGAIEGVVVTNGGSGYSSDKQTTAVVEKPTTKNGTQAKITVYVNNENGSIDTVTIDDPGSGYTTTPKITIIDTSGKGEGKYGNATAKLSAHLLNGKLDSVTIDDPGVKYPADINTTLSATGDGEGCVLYPKIMNGKIVGVIVADAGEGYSYLDVKAISHNSAGSGATFQAIIGGSNLSGDQASVEQTTTIGAIYSIVVKQGGEEYSDETQVVIDGDGEGATAEAIVENGAIKQIVMTSYGKNYTYVNVSFKDEKRLEPNSYIDAEAYAILPPVNGHGYDAVNELYGDVFCIYVSVRDDNQLINLNQDYRQFGVIENPKDLRTLENITQTDVTVSFKLTLLTTADLVPDLNITIDGIKHRVVAVSGNQVIVQQLSSRYYQIDQYSGVIYKNEQTGAIRYYEITHVDEIPTVNKYSGDLLYSDNNTPFILSSGRTFGIRTFITF